MQESINQIWNFVRDNAEMLGLALALLVAIGGTYTYISSKKEKNIEDAPEFESDGVNYSLNGRRIKLKNATGNPAKVLEIMMKRPTGYSNSTPLNMTLETNNNQFFVEVAGRTGEVKFDLIFEGRLRKKYKQTVVFITGSKPTYNDTFTITRSKRC